MLNIFKKNKLISLLLAFVLTFGMLFSSAIPVYATDINKSDGNGKSKVVTTVTPAKFNVTVPYVLPISIDADQNVYTADNVAIKNNSNGPIKVSDATLTTNEGWELVADGTDFNSVPVNSKQFTITVLNSPVLTSGIIDTDSFGTINGNSSLNVNYNAEAAVQGEEVSATNIANILFTIEWDNVEITSATVSKTALQSFAKTVTTFQKTSERLNIDDVKATEGLTKIDDGATDKSIYAWADSDGNGYWWTDAMLAYLPNDSSFLFGKYGTANSILVSVDLTGFDTSNVSDMRLMFRECRKLISLNLTSIDTSNVTNMSQMFYGCTGLTSLDLSSFDTSNVTDMSSMFSNCYGLTSLDLSSFDTSNVTTMCGMFNSCYELTSLDLSSFDTSNVTDMSSMFRGHNNKLSSLDLSSFDTSNVTDMEFMFFMCSELTSLDLSSFDTSNVTNMSNMFVGCSGLTSLDLSSFDTSNVTDMTNMFSYCSGLTSLVLSSFVTNNVTTMRGMFSDCSNLTSLDLSSFATNNVTNLNTMFYRSDNLKTINVSNFNTDSVTDSDYMFYGCSSLVGGNDTKYNSSYTDKTYARIDTADKPGYFTYKAKAA